MVSGRGYIALSMVILGNWKPLWVALGRPWCTDLPQSLQFRLQGVNIPPQLVQMLPYILTLVVLLFARKKSSAPAASGKTLLPKRRVTVGKIQIDTEHARKMADDYSYVMRSFADAYAAQKKG